MKKLLFIFVFSLFSINTFACKCESFGAVGIQYHNAEFVGEVEVLKTYDSNSRNRIYKADFQILKIYKGKPIKTVKVFGVIDDIQTSACEIELKQGEKYLIYLSKNGGDQIISMTSRGGRKLVSEEYFVSACTPKTLISKEIDKNLELERKVNDFLSKNLDDLAQVFFLDKSVTENSEGDLKNYELKNAKNSFAIFKLKINDKSEIENIESLHNFGSENDNELMNLIKKNFIIIKGFFEEVQNEEVYLTLFYLPENKNEKYLDTISLRLNYF